MVQSTLALSDSFLDSQANLPKAISKKVRKLIKLYRSDPTSPGIHFEKLPGMKDEKVRSLRIDQAYRMIAVQPPRGDLLMAVWVDHHDEAYQWARTRRFEINPSQGSIQVYSVDEVEKALESVRESTGRSQTPATTDRRLFDDHDNDALELVGVPKPLLAAVRALETEEDLDALAGHLPDGVSQMLYSLLLGYSLEDALEEVFGAKEPAGSYDTEDFAAALERPATRGSFWVVEGEEELERVLDAPLEKWRVFLHPTQRRLVTRKASGPMRVLGGAGTGKTVVLMHRAKHLIENIFAGPEDRILVTTFTKNLALDLRNSLATLCPGGIDRIEVQNLHAWALSVAAEALGRKVRVIREDDRRAAMDSARKLAGVSAFSLAFFQEEWDRVVQAQAIGTEVGYLRARRVGRGTRLAASQRRDVWRVLSRYREILNSQGVLEWQDVVREAKNALDDGRVKRRYRAVLADEVQDMSPSDLKLLRAIVPPGSYDMFLVGDAHQRIYGNMARLGACGIDIRGRSRRLRLNYRTTDQIRARAVAILEGLEIDDLDGGVDTLTGYRSLRNGPEPEVHVCSTLGEENALIEATVELWLKDTRPRDICITARTKRLVNGYAEALESAGYSTVHLRAEASPTDSGIRIATMHRLKGLEFKKVLLCGVHDGAVPLVLPQGANSDAGSRADHVKSERCLLYVAATRARDEVFITGHGRPSPLLESGGDSPT